MNSELLLDVREIPASHAMAMGKRLTTRDEETIMLATHYRILRTRPCPQCGKRDCLTWPNGTLSLALSEEWKASGENGARMLVRCEACQHSLWHSTDGPWGQFFTFQFHDAAEVWTWAIGYATELVGMRDSEHAFDRMVSPIEMARALAINESTWEMDPLYAMTTDLSKPIIAIKSPHPYRGEHRMIVIDGWHRMIHAVMKEVPMPAVVLTPEEAALCHVLIHPK